MKHRWVRLLKRSGLPVLQYSYILSAYQDQYHRDLLYLQRGIHNHRYLDGAVDLDSDDYEALLDELSKRLTPEYLSFFHLKCKDESDRLLETALRIRQLSPYSTYSNVELTVLFSTYSAAAIRVMTFLTIVVLLETALKSHLVRRFDQYTQVGKMGTTREELFNILLFPRAKGLPSLAMLDLYRLADYAMQVPALAGTLADETTVASERLASEFPQYSSRLHAYLSQYDFMTMEYYVGRPMTLSDLLRQLRDILPNAQSRLQTFEHDQATAAQAFDDLIRNIELTPEDHLMLSKAHDIHYQRQYRSDALFKAGRDVYDLLSHIAERIGLAYDELLCLTAEEIALSLLHGSLQVAPETVASRHSGYAITLSDGNAEILTGVALADARASAFPPSGAQPSEVCGTTASPGRFTGPVAIVITHLDVPKVQPGAVLISPMTDPYYMPALLRAGAIVTDEGPLGSHAAIIARELGIPCIIETDVASTTFSDGMIVEVDASHPLGVVRRIE